MQWRGDRWFEALVLDKKAYKKLCPDFVDFASSKQRKNVRVARLPEVEITSTSSMAPPPLPWLWWQPNIIVGHRRLELLGDSMTVTNWGNGVWPVKSDKYYGPIV